MSSVDTRVLFFGDSHVLGVGDPEGRGWVGRVVAECFAAGVPLTAYNLGVRRETSEQVAARLHAETLPRRFPRTDTRIVLSAGGNDTTLEDGRLRVAPSRSAATLARMLAELDAAGLPAFVVGPAPVADPSQAHRERELSAAFAQLCAGVGVPFVDVIEPLLASETWMGEAAAGDGAHPRAAGYAALAQLVLDAGFVDWLRARRA